MSLMPGIRNHYFGPFVGSLFYDLTFCVLSSLLSLASYIAGIRAVFLKGTNIMLTYTSGRINTCTLLDSAMEWPLNKAPLFLKRISIFGALALIILGVGAEQKAMKVTRS